MQVSDGGITVIDDTYNSNPDGALNALTALASASAGRRKVVVTPGMVELGRQAAANQAFAGKAASVASDILIVGRTNRPALRKGAAAGKARVTICASRPEAVAWVRRNLSS